jgi:hypothetical protein
MNRIDAPGAMLIVLTIGLSFAAMGLQPPYQAWAGIGAGLSLVSLGFFPTTSKPRQGGPRMWMVVLLIAGVASGMVVAYMVR